MAGLNMTDLIIEDIPLTKSWLAELVEKKIGVKPTIGTSGILDNSELGYMSMIRKVKLHFNAEQQEKHSKLPKHVVLKIACSAKGIGAIESAGGETAEAKDGAAIEQYMHNTELKEKSLKVPLIYAAAKADDNEAPVPVIVMEMFEGCKVHDLIQGFDEKQLYKIVDEIVKLHIFSLTTEEWKEIKPDAKMAAVADIFETMVKTVAENLAMQPGLELIATYVKNTFDKDPKFMQKAGNDYLNGKRPSVLCHGDLWAPQILWDEEDNIAGIIDWQTAHRGSPLEDLHFILSTCTSVENRKKLTKPLFEYYFDKLSAGLEAEGVKNPWTREDIDEEYKHSLVHGAALTIFCNGFLSNSPVLQTNGKPDLAKITESFARCRSYIEETVQEHNMS